MKTETSIINIPPKKEISHEKWVEFRRHYLGGSDVSAILGKSKYRTPLMVWMQKQGYLPTEDDSAIMNFGNDFEPILANHFMKVTGLRTQIDNRLRQHSVYPFLRGNIDRLILSNDRHDGPGVLELKTTTSHAVKAWVEPIPVEWKYQIMHYLSITGYGYSYLMVYERDTCKYHEPVFIERDDAFISEMTKQCVSWWMFHMEGRRKPQSVSSSDVFLLYPESNSGQSVEGGVGCLAIAQTLGMIRERIKKYEQDVEQLEFQLKNELGASEILMHRGKPICSWKTTETSRFDTTAIKEQEPDLYQKYLKKTTSRRFVLHKLDGGKP